MNYIISEITNALNYEKYFLENTYLQNEGLTLIPKLNKSNAITAGKVFNGFLDGLPADASWLVFTHDYFEFKEDVFECIKYLSKNALYGVWGARLTANHDGIVMQECLGKILIKESSTSSPYFLYNGLSADKKIIPAETLDSLCLIVHASKVRNSSFRFDEKLKFLYGEDLCLRAFDELGLPSKIIPIDTCVHRLLFHEKESLEQDIFRCTKRYASKPLRAGVHNIFGDGPHFGERIFIRGVSPKDSSKIYHRDVACKDYNIPVVVASKMLHKGARVLDCGCACGDNGIFLKKRLNADCYGMEYDKQSIKIAKQSGVYKDIHHVDLNAFSPHEYSQYYAFFDYILLLDVLEHLYRPSDVLQKLQVFLKNGGAFILSVPNIAHAYPVSNLLSFDFTYQDFGILDSTHIRFFTWKSLAMSLAKWRFNVLESNVTFVSPDSRGMMTPTTLPQSFYDYIFKDLHTISCQYVCLVRPSDEPFKVLKIHNLTLLENAVHNNPEGLGEVEGQIRLFIQKIELAQGRGLTNAKKHLIVRLCGEGKYIEAILNSGFFNEEWYRKTYNEIDFSEKHPLEDYLTLGWRAGRNPGQAFDTVWYLNQYPAAQKSGLCPLLYHLTIGLKLGLPYSQNCSVLPEQELINYVKHIFSQEERYKNTFVSFDTSPYVREEEDPKLIAFYLPQFAPFPENDQWWGKGFTEWTNVTKSVPQFAGHYQPRLPYDVGFYDLRIKEIAYRQEELAKHYGIYGFCYHYYWFGGKKIMHAPIESKLEDKKLTLPFCISWANESWSANWDGSRNNLLIDQPEQIDVALLFDDLCHFFKDKRYVKVDGKPFFMIYRPAFFPLGILRHFIVQMKKLAQKNGFPGLHIVLGNTFRAEEQKLTLNQYGADAFIEFPPHKFTMEESSDVVSCNPKFKGRIFDLKKLVSIYKQQKQPSDFTYRTLFPMWDNTARKAETGAMVYINSTPDVYSDWLYHNIKITRRMHEVDKNYIFINAWNEWAEGAYLEPDRKYGYAFLASTRNTIYQSRKKQEFEKCRAIFISAYIDNKIYKNNLVENIYIKSNKACRRVSFDNRKENICIPKRYNQFIKEYDFRESAWLIFCHSDWEVLEDIVQRLEHLEKGSIYGPIGAILHDAGNDMFVREYRGQCIERKRDGTNMRRLVCESSKTGDMVDTLDCQSLIVHSSLIEKYGLRFDENFNFDLYAEDFCINSLLKHGLKSRILNINCCHWNQADSMEGRGAYFNDLEYINRKYPDHIFAGTVSLIGGRSQYIASRCTNITPRVAEI